MNYHVISTAAALKEYLVSIAGEKYIALDTEFMREKTFFAQLCLVQIATSKGAAIVDILSPALGDATLLWEFLEEDHRVKIFHSASQDLEIIYHIRNKLPPNVIDTQIMGAVLGLGDNIGYQKLVEYFLKKDLDKTMQYTNWALRPLSKKALDYAALDVIYLFEISHMMEKQLQQQHRQEWVKEEMKKLLNVDTYKLAPEIAWQRLKKFPKSAKKFRALQLMAEWREHTAIERDLPRGFVIRDELLFEIANHLPKNEKEMSTIRNISSLLNHKKNLEAVLAIIRRVQGEPLPPHVEEKEQYQWESSHDNALEVLKLLLKITARRQAVAARIVARESDLIDFLLHKPSPQIMSGWRYDVFGKNAEKLLQGKLSLRLQGNEIEFIEVA
ncbi:MAG: ribonuclease D [Alphaproteobacteria bacterium]|nr:ribonuclease D [Alphaproteobacteria bacterium]